METALKLTLLVLCYQFSVVSPSKCDQNEYPMGDKCCQLCAPGQKLVAECTAESESRCKACSLGEFQGQWNRKINCLSHAHCDSNAGFYKRTEGTAVTDAECVCREGLHCSSEQCETCVPHTPCRQGLGVTRKADALGDTGCEPCQEGTFSSNASLTEPCRPWTSCEAQALVTEVPGTKVSDATCGQKPSESRSLVAAGATLGASIVLVLIVVVVVAVCISRRKGRLNNRNEFQQVNQNPEPQVNQNPEPRVNQNPEPRVNQNPEPLVEKGQNPQPEERGQIPEEMEDPAGSSPHPPVQETMKGGQTDQEEWKDSRMPQQEVV